MPQQSWGFESRVQVRSAAWRYTEWLAWDGSALCPRAPVGRAPRLAELYSHADDIAPFDLDAAEYENVAAQNPSVVAEMRAVLERKVHYC